MPLPHRSSGYHAHQLETQDAFSSDDDSSVSDVSLDSAIQAPESYIQTVPQPKPADSFFGDTMLVVQTKDQKDEADQDGNLLGFQEVDGSEFLKGKHSHQFGLKDFDCCMSPNPFIDKLEWSQDESRKIQANMGLKSKVLNPEKSAKSDRKRKKIKKRKSSRRSDLKRSKSVHDLPDNVDEPVTLEEIRKEREMVVRKETQVDESLAGELSARLGSGMRELREHRAAARAATMRATNGPQEVYKASSPGPHMKKSTGELPKRSKHSLTSELLSSRDKRAAMQEQQSASSLTLSASRVDLVIAPFVPKSIDRRAMMAHARSVPALQATPTGARRKKLQGHTDLSPSQLASPSTGTRIASPKGARSGRRGLQRTMSERGGLSMPKPANLRQSSKRLIMKGLTEEPMSERPVSPRSTPPTHVQRVQEQSPVEPATSLPRGRRAGLRRAVSERGTLGRQLSRYDVIDIPPESQAKTHLVSQKLSLSDHRRTIFR